MKTTCALLLVMLPHCGVHADEPNRTAERSARESMRITPRPDAVLRQRLDKPLNVEFGQTPLTDVAEFVAEACNVPIILDEIALEEEGIPLGEPITHRCREVAAGTFLDRILEPLNLTWFLRDSTVRISSTVVAEEVGNGSFVFYDVHRILSRTPPTEPSPVHQLHRSRHWLARLIVEVVGPDWVHSSHVLADRVLVVRGNSRVQEQTERLLESLANVLESPPEGRTVHPWPSEREREIRKLFDKPISIDFDDTPLAEVAEQIAEQLKVDVLFDEIALEEEGIPLDEPITRTVENLALRSTFRLLLEPLNLVPVVRKDAIVITSTIVAEEFGNSEPVIFDLRWATKKVPLDDVIDLIIRVEPPNDWNPDPYNFAFETVPGGLLVIRHIETTRRRVEFAVDEVRRTVARMPDRAPDADARTAEVRSYSVESNVEQVEQLVRTFVDEANWDAKDGGRIGVVGDQLMIRTTRVNHAKITSLLAKLRPNVPVIEAPVQGGFGTPPRTGGGFFAFDDSAIRRPKPNKPKRPALPRGVTVDRDLVYATRGDRAMKLDLYRPEKITGPLPVVIWVHGGGWKNGSKNRCPATWLMPHGFAVASIDYRLTDVAQWPAQMDDCRDAVRWLRSNAKNYSLDGEHIGAWGSSAGGHLVALMGTLPTPDDEKVSSRVQAVCDWYGPSDLLTMPPNLAPTRATSNGAKLLGKTVIEVPELAKQVSAFHQVSKDDAPFLIMHGDKDPGVPLEQSTKLHEKLTAAGISSTLHVVKGAGHGGKGFQTDEVRHLVRSFFETNLRPAGE